MVSAGSGTPTGEDLVKPKSLLEVSCQMKGLMVVAFLLPFSSSFVANIGGGFMRSIVDCAPPLPDVGGQCPVGSFFHAGSCEAAPHGHADWSFSNHCADKAHVVTTAIAAGGKMILVSQAALIVGVTTLGPQLDIWGRKPLLLLAFVAHSMGGGLVAFSTYVKDTSGQFALVMASVAVSQLFDVSYAARFAMVADMSRTSASERSTGFAAVRLAGLLGTLIALAVCFGILSLNLAEYRPVWFAYCLLAVLFTLIAAMVLRETLPDEPHANMADDEAATPAGESNALKRRGSHQALTLGVCQMCQQIANAACLVWRDPLLGHITLIGGVNQAVTMGFIATIGGYLLEALGYTQAMTQLPGVVHPLVGLLSTCWCPHLIRRWGAPLTSLAGMLVGAVGFAMLGLSSVFTWGTHVLFWPGFCLTSFGSSLPGVALLAVMSIRVDAYSQGKLDALSHFVGLLGGMSGSYLWSHHLYAGWRQGLLFWPAAAAGFGSMLWLALVCRRWPVPPAAAPAVPSSNSV